MKIYIPNAFEKIHSINVHPIQTIMKRKYYLRDMYTKYKTYNLINISFDK